MENMKLKEVKNPDLKETLIQVAWDAVQDTNFCPCGPGPGAVIVDDVRKSTEVMVRLALDPDNEFVHEWYGWDVSDNTRNHWKHELIREANN